MNSKLLTVLLIFFSGLTIRMQAQDAQKQQAEEKEKQELGRKFREGMKARNMERMNGKTVEVQDSKYNRREPEIMSKLNTATIPNDFPMYTSGITNEQYTDQMNAWYSSHPALVKKESTNDQK